MIDPTPAITMALGITPANWHQQKQRLAEAGFVVVPILATERMCWCHEMPDIGPDEISALWSDMIAEWQRTSGDHHDD